METYYIDKVANKVTEYQAKLTEAVTTASLVSGSETVEESNVTNHSALDSSSPTSQEDNQGEQLNLTDDIFTPPADDKTRVISSDVHTTTPSEQDIADILGAFSSFSDSSIREIVELLSYSLLSGEFLSIKEVDKVFDSLIKQIQDIVTLIAESLKTSKHTYEIERILLNFTNSVIYCIQGYLRFERYVFIHFSKNRSEDYFLIEDESTDIIPLISNSLQDVIQLFTLVLKVSRKDLLINSDRSELQSLIILKQQVDNLKGVLKSVAYVLDIKLEFLIHKWGERYKCENKNQKNSIKYEIGGTEKSIGSFELETSTLKDWSEKIYYHYDFCKDKKEYGRYIHNILNKKRKGYNELDFTELHGLIKYYKDVNRSESELNQIVNYLLEKDCSDKNNYDQYCIEIFRNYAINNYFSLISENKTLDLDEYQNKYLECKSKLNHLSDNYFLEKKYLDYVLKRIDAEFATSSKEDKISVHQKYADKVDKECSDILDEYYEKKEWAKTHDNYIVILPYEESLVELSKKKFPNLPKILFFTSFVLPYYKDSIDYEYSKTRQLFREVKALTSVVGSLKADLQKLENLNKEFDKKDLKSIETISLFTAVITFVLSSIPAFKFVETVQHATLFMLSMSASLGIFILLIFSFTRGFSKFFKKQRNIIVAFLIVFILFVTTFSLISFEKKSVDGIIRKSIQNKKEQKEIDSLKNELKISN